MSMEPTGSGRMADEQRARLRRAFELLSKVAGHEETALVRHGSVLPEWVMAVLANPRAQPVNSMRCKLYKADFAR